MHFEYNYPVAFLHNLQALMMRRPQIGELGSQKAAVIRRIGQSCHPNLDPKICSSQSCVNVCLQLNYSGCGGSYHWKQNNYDLSWAPIPHTGKENLKRCIGNAQYIGNDGYDDDALEHLC